jgi:hypothetical protein
MLEIFLTANIAIGLMIIFEAWQILRPGKLRMITAATSSIEFIWVIITAIALFKLAFTQLQLAIPVLFLSYNILGWLYGIYLAIQASKLGIGRPPTPKTYILICFSFGVLFTLLSVSVFFNINS